jgi:hypothetical protein
MAIRDLSPSQWTAPGTARVSLNALLTSHGFDPLPLDVWVDNYALNDLRTVTMASGFNTLTVPDTARVRMLIVIPPRGNATAWTMKGVTGDTGFEQNPNGFFLTTFDGSAAASVGLTAAAEIVGFTLIWI